MADNKVSINAPRPEDVGSFWRRMTTGGAGPAKASKFLISISPPSFPKRELLTFPSDLNRLRDLTFQCEATELPGRTLATSDVQIQGPTFKLPYGSTYNDITFNFLCTNDMYEKKIFDSWMNYISNINNFTMTYRDEYATSVGIFQYDEGGRTGPQPAVTYGAILVDAFPIGVNQLNLSWAEDGIHRLSVTFAYTYYKPVGALGGGGVAFPTDLSSYFAQTLGVNSSFADPLVVSSLITNPNIGTVEGFLAGTSTGAFTGLTNFLGSFFA